MSTPIQNAERKDFLCCVIVTAVEGGSNFWAAFRNYVHKENGNYLLTEASVEVKDSQGDYPADWKAVGALDDEARKFLPTLKALCESPHATTNAT